MTNANKYVIIIQANQQDVGKAVHGLLYGQELHDEGFQVEILFDGAGTEWPNELSKADHPFHALYKQVMKSGIVKGGCQACSGFHNIEEEMQGAGVSLIGNAKTGGHIPFAQYMKDGFIPIVL
ncbi:DsrE family protein [Paenibacillus harenae]|uniref:DsrE family protein n=1 Tax=Paenibacillus harenae TaxID=306543 RepID=UPI000420F0B3|nr:DsrE family protein [Paenibacillus harenae]